MPDTSRSQTPTVSPNNVAELYSTYVEAVRDAQLSAQKNLYAAHRGYVDSVQKYLRELPLQDTLRAPAEAMHSSWVKQDAHQYVEATRQYANSVQDAYVSVQRVLQEAYTRFVQDVQEAVKTASEAQQSHFESFLRSLQQTFNADDMAKVDSATLGRMSQIMLAAAWMRAYSK